MVITTAKVYNNHKLIITIIICKKALYMFYENLSQKFDHANSCKSISHKYLLIDTNCLFIVIHTTNDCVFK